MVRPRLTWRTVVWLILIGLALVWVYNYTRLIQAFENADEEKTVKDELTTAMTAVSEMLCPMQKEVLKKLVEDELTEDENMNGGLEKVSSERRKEIDDKAASELLKAAQGRIFPCPPPSNPQEIPVAIKDYILGTARGCAPTVAKIKNNIAKARECPKLEGFSSRFEHQSTARSDEGFEHQSTARSDEGFEHQSTAHSDEGFEHQSTAHSDEGFDIKIPVYVDYTTTEAYEDVATTNEAIVKKNRIVALQAKLRGIKEAMMDPIFQQTIVDYKEVKSLKDQAENGTLTPNCAT